jgi:hypothetical protein
MGAQTFFVCPQIAHPQIAHSAIANPQTSEV